MMHRPTPPDVPDHSEDQPIVLALGDSLTSGHGLPPGAAFPEVLERLLRKSFPRGRVINAGVSGDTTGDALRRLPRVLSSLRSKPALAIVELGANDLRRGVAPVETRQNLESIVIELRRMAMPVLLATIEPPPTLSAFGKAYHNIYADVAARHGIRTHPFFPKGVLGHPDFVLFDRIHPNAAAIEQVSHHMIPAVLEELDQVIGHRSFL